MKMKFKKVQLGLTLLMLLIMIAGCGVEKVNDDLYKDDESESLEVTYPVVIKDKFGQDVTIEAEPQTMISMSPELTEIIFALDSGSKLIGRSKYCDYPAEVEAIQEFGSLFDLNAESIVEADPDIVFLSSMADEELVTGLKDLGLTVLTFDKDSSLEGTYEYINLLGKVLNKKSEAADLNTKIQDEIAEVAEKVAELEKPKTYYVVWAAENSASTATGDTFINNILVTAGADNVAKDGTDWTYSVEKLVEDDPYIVICPSNGMKENVEALIGYKDLTAVKEGRVYEVSEDIMSRQGPRIGEAVRAIAEILHPEAF